jgi:hypothetical protein
VQQKQALDQQPGFEPANAIAERERLGAADLRLALVAAAVVAFSIFYILANYRAAFPQASLDMPLSRDQINARALSFLRSQQLAPAADFRNVTLFDPDDNARLFLEREAGLDRANRLMQSEVPVWRWRARWYRPPGKEEFLAWLDPRGRMVAFDHAVPETAAGARLEVADARRRAESFLRAQRTQPHRLVEEKSEDLPNRRDHLFTFERDGFRLNDATVRVGVVVRGDKVDSFREYLRVPDQWQRSFSELRSKNELYTRIAQVFYFALLVAAAGYMIAYLRRHAIRWAPLAVAAGVVGVLSVLVEWNNLPFYLDSLPTATSVREGLLMILLQAVGSGVMTMLMLLLLAGPGSVLYRELLPDRLTLGDALLPRAWKTREFFRSALAGVAMAAGHIAFITAFYLVGQRLGVWSPQDVEHSNLLSTWAPWLYPLTMSLQAATSEEFCFRVFAVPLVKRWTGSTWIAVLGPAFAWGFLHANYPQQPGYIRGVEVGIIGVVAGVVMLRFGILATLVWHYTVDAVLFSTYLFPAADWLLRISGFAVSGAVLVPVAYGLWHYRRDGGFLTDRRMQNRDATAAAAPAMADLPAAGDGVEHPPIGPVWPRRWLYIAAAAAGLVGLLVKPQSAGEGTAIAASRHVALQAAGPPPEGWKQSVEFVANTDGDVYEYLRRHVGHAEANRILAERTRIGVWRIRHFKPQSKTERYVFADARGRVFRRDLVLEEKAPGANLDAGQARAAAERYLEQEQGIDPSAYKLVDSSTEKRANRTDHAFVWEDPSFHAGEARARVSVDLLGDQPSGFRRFIKLPEEWQREHNKPRLLAMLVPSAVGGFAFMALIAFLRNLSRCPFRWRNYLSPAIAVVLLTAVSEWNESPWFYRNYDTAQPLGDFVSEAVAGLATRTLLLGFVIFLGAYALDVYLYLLGGRRRLEPPSLPHALAMALFAAGVARYAAGIDGWIPGDRYSSALWSPPPVATLWPWLNVVADAGIVAIAGAIFGSMLIAALLTLYSPGYRLGFLLIGAAGIAVARSGSPWVVAFHFVTALALMAAAGFVVRTSGAAVHSLALAIFLGSAGRGAWQLWSAADPSLRDQGLVAAVVATGLGAAALLRFQGRGANPSADPETSS